MSERGLAILGFLELMMGGAAAQAVVRPPEELPPPPYVDGAYPLWPTSRFRQTIVNGLALAQESREGGRSSSDRTADPALAAEFLLGFDEAGGPQMGPTALGAFRQQIEAGRAWSDALYAAAPHMPASLHGKLQFAYNSQLALEGQTLNYFQQLPATTIWPFAFELVVQGVRVPFEFRPLTGMSERGTWLSGDFLGADAVETFSNSIGLGVINSAAAGAAAVESLRAKRRLQQLAAVPSMPALPGLMPQTPSSGPAPAPNSSAAFPSIQRPIAGPAWQHGPTAAAAFASSLAPLLIPFGWYGLPPPPLGSWFLQASSLITGAP